MPGQLLANAAGKSPLLGQHKQRAEVWLLAKTEVGQHRLRVLKWQPGFEVATEAIALLSPLSRRDRLTGTEERSPQVGFASRRSHKGDRSDSCLQIQVFSKDCELNNLQN